eukprot:COSAG06_NODE_11006_length_1582_cov_10.614970_2_plen_66_part_00
MQKWRFAQGLLRPAELAAADPAATPQPQQLGRSGRFPRLGGRGSGGPVQHHPDGVYDSNDGNLPT